MPKSHPIPADVTHRFVAALEAAGLTLEDAKSVIGNSGVANRMVVAAKRTPPPEVSMGAALGAAVLDRARSFSPSSIDVPR